MVEQPAGTVTLFFSDIEGSTRLLQELGPEAYREALAEHRRVVRAAFQRHGGYEVGTEGDAFFVAFASPNAAVAAAREAQAELDGGAVSVRMGLHTGEPILDPPEYVGVDVHLAARVMSAGHGGQVLITAATRNALPPSDTVLLGELGEHRLKDFDRPVALFQLGEVRFPPLKTVSNTNLPWPASSFVGREREVGEVTELVREARLVTLTGPGGTGKTRLAIEAAAELVGAFKAGVFWVGLATLRDPALVVETIAQTLGAKDDLAVHVGERELLLLLDNFEQVVDAAPELSALLRACPSLRLLVTSRELLRIDGEAGYPVPTLDEPEAVELFCARSRLEPDETVSELCRRLDDLPLAVELAAARTSVLSPAQILDRLGQRLDLLKGGRDTDPRQQTLRTAIEWSYELLDSEERQLFARLAVFAGGCTLEAAEEIADAELDVLQSLVGKSLVRHADGRYWMLETIQEFAGERLAAFDGERSFRRSHAEHFAELAAQGDQELVGAAAAEWTRRLTADHDNCRAALSYARDAGHGDLFLRIAATLGNHFWWQQGHLAEGRRTLDQALGATDGPSDLRTIALLGMSSIAWAQGDISAMSDYAEAAVDTARGSEDDVGLRRGLIALANAASVRGDLDRAQALYEDCLARVREAGDLVGVAAVLGNLGNIALARHEDERALAFALEDIAISRELEDRFALGSGLTNAAIAELRLGRIEDAASHVREAVQMFSDLRSPRGLYSAFNTAASLAVACGRIEDGAMLLGASDALADASGFSLDPVPYEMAVETRSRLEAELGSAAQTLQSEGRKLTLDGAVALALSLD